MLSLNIHNIYIDNRSPAPNTTQGSPNRISRHQRGHVRKNDTNTTQTQITPSIARASMRQAAEWPVHSPSTLQNIPGHPGRHGTTCPHATSQTLPEAVAQRRGLPRAPQLLVRRRRIVLPRGRPQHIRMDLCASFGGCAGIAQCRAALVNIMRLAWCLSHWPPGANAAAALAVEDGEVGAPLRS